MDMEQIDSWEDPPVRTSRRDPRHRYTQVVKGLRENRGVWAKLAPRDNDQAAKSLAANINKGRLGSFSPQGAFEAEYRDSLVWVRYVGEPDGVEAKKKYVRPSGKTASAVRTWAKANGRSVSERGPLPTTLVAEWERAMRGEGAE